MLIYETGMSEPQYLACLMEDSLNTKISLNVQMELSERGKILVRRYQDSIAKYYTSKGMKCDFIVPKYLHVSISNPFMGTELLRGDLWRGLQAFDRPLTLQYADTDSDDNNLVISFQQSNELNGLRTAVEQILLQYGTRPKPFSPHMAIGKQPSDTPDESITTNPGFKALTFDWLQVTAR